MSPNPKVNYESSFSRTMPRESHYLGLEISDALREFAEFHGKKKTRHITQYEVKLLRDAADMIDRLRSD